MTTNGVTGEGDVSVRATVVREPQDSDNGNPAVVSDDTKNGLLDLSEQENNATVRVHSGDRTPQQNASIGGATNSAHVTNSGAADISIDGKTGGEAARAAYKTGAFGRTNEYSDGRVHVDTREPNGSEYYYDWLPQPAPNYP